MQLSFRDKYINDSCFYNSNIPKSKIDYNKNPLSVIQKRLHPAGFTTITNYFPLFLAFGTSEIS
ncbi:hypothetical protein [Flavobacterium aquicola]|uniref:hypothetical protein n=1 Tax=Flavobacterium aquicola TaxID=1682742 RepID=UPI000E270078|nr:hypothetical protein [Flavobacterium aquicola]